MAAISNVTPDNFSNTPSDSELEGGHLVWRSCMATLHCDFHGTPWNDIGKSFVNTVGVFGSFIGLVRDRSLPIRTITVTSNSTVVTRHRFIPSRSHGVCSRAGDCISATVNVTVRSNLLSLSSQLISSFPRCIPSSTRLSLNRVALERLLAVSDNFGRTCLVGPSQHDNVNTPSCLQCVFSHEIRIRPNDAFYCSSTSSSLTNHVLRRTTNVHLNRCLCNVVFSGLSRN